MLTKREIEDIRALREARSREQKGLFVIEGLRLVRDMLGTMPCQMLAVSTALETELSSILNSISSELYPKRIEIVPESFDFSRISSQRTPQPILAIMSLPRREDIQLSPRGLSLLLDTVQDPGNVGTIIRTADWMGIQDIYLTAGCADPYAPKVVQSTMGALSRVRLHRLRGDGTELLANYQGVVLGTFLDGASIYESDFKSIGEDAMLIMGNEGNGISPPIEALCNHRITIPAYGSAGTESLNVAIAASLCIAEIRRQRGHTP